MCGGGGGGGGGVQTITKLPLFAEADGVQFLVVLVQKGYCKLQIASRKTIHFLVVVL